MGKAKPTQEAIDAAREAVRLNPRPEWQSNPEVALEGLARIYLRIGRDRFEIMFGLRQAQNTSEQASRDLFKGQISADEYDRLVAEHCERPVDEPMIRLFYHRQDRQLSSYGLALAEIELQGKLVPSGSGACWGIERVQRHIDDWNSTPFQDARELWEVNELARRARVQSHMDVLRFGEEEWNTVSDAAWHFTDLLRMTLKVSQGRIGPGGVDDVHRMLLKGGFMSARMLRNEIAREQDAVLLNFAAQAREVSSALKAVAVHVQAEKCTVTSANVANVTKPRTSDPALTNPILTVQRWSDLAIGIDATKKPWEVWADTPVPDLGRRFTKSIEKRVMLKRKTWYHLLRLAANSSNGRSVALHDLAVAWHLVPLRQAGRSRIRQEETEEGEIEADRLSWSNSSMVAVSFRKAVDDLRRRVRALISGPADRSDTLLTRNDTTLDTGFVVRFLFVDQSGNVIFGKTPWPEKGG